MALVPGAYARAAGLQSEINKVTVTRVAGSEVQFRRTIDTYQRDLRYHVNQIGREQRVLRRSLRRYSKKLLDSSKDRHQRQRAATRARQQADRSDPYRQTPSAAEELSVKKLSPRQPGPEQAAVPLVNSTCDQPLVENHESGVLPHPSEHAHSGAGQPPQHQSCTTMPPAATLADSPDSGVGSDVEDTASPAPESANAVQQPPEKTKARRAHKAFLTSNRNKLPYLKAKREGSTTNKMGEERAQHKGSSTQDHMVISTRLSDNEELLPSITEENEEAVDQFKLSKSDPNEAAGQSQDQANDSLADPDKGSHATSAVRVHPPVVVTSLDTKSVSQPGKPYAARPIAPACNAKEAKTDEDGGNSVTSTEDTGPVLAVTRKKRQQKTGVSYGDLIKLHHTHTSSSTKELFKLVDRLASVHGIADPPPLPSSSTPASLDPRTNVRIKRRTRASGQRTMDGIVKQAAVLYSMKYGYNLPTDSEAEDAPAPPVPGHLQIPNDDTADDKVREKTVRYPTHARMRRGMSRMPGVISDPIQQSTLSVRHDSTDVTSPFYEFGEAASAIFDDCVLEGVSPSRWNKSKPLTLTKLSVLATKIRERTLQGPQIPQDKTEDMDSDKVQHRNNRKLKGNVVKKDSTTEEGGHRARLRSRALSPVPRRSRSPSHQRSDSVQEQLQRRLNDGGEAGKMAWQSAFGRLKMIHTLFDLTQHFSKH